MQTFYIAKGRQLNTQINNKKDRTHDVVFSRFRGFSFTITLRKKPKGVTHMPRCITRQRESMCVTPLGFCLRVIVNKKNLEKTTSSVLSILLLICCITGRKNFHKHLQYVYCFCTLLILSITLCSTLFGVGVQKLYNLSNFL